MNLLNLVSFLKKNLLFISIILIAILPRFIFLNSVPNAINEDELHYVIDAKSFFLTGKDTLGQVTPIDVLFFKSPKSGGLQAELQYFLEIPVFGLMGFSLFNLVLPNVLLGILSVVLIYLITLRLFNKNTAILAGLVAAMNPWLIFISRTTYEAGPATLFFLCTFYILLVTKKWRILLAIPFALLAFYSYIGTKLLFLPFMFISISYAYLYVSKKKYLKQYFLVFIFCVFLTGFFLLALRQYDVSRAAEIILPNNPEITKQTILLREAAMQSPITYLFDNKISVYLSVLIKNVFNAFSPVYLFVSASYFFMTGGHGLFYYIDSIFLVIGLGLLFLRNRKLFITFIVILLIGILPSVLHNPNGSGTFPPHIALIIPFFIILIGVGIEGVLKIFKNKKYLYAFFICLGFLYFIAFLNFSYFYFFKFPLQEATFEAQGRVLSKYISLYDKDVPISVFSARPKFTYREFIFYTNAYNNETMDMVNKSLREEKFVFNNISFVPCDYMGLKDIETLIISDVSCSKTFNSKKLNIVQFKDSGSRYSIFNDSICSNFKLSQFISKLSLSSFNIEDLSAKNFCETFIISY